jgi:hypothetical protein
MNDEKFATESEKQRLAQDYYSQSKKPEESKNELPEFLKNIPVEIVENAGKFRRFIQNESDS